MQSRLHKLGPSPPGRLPVDPGRRWFATAHPDDQILIGAARDGLNQLRPGTWDIVSACIDGNLASAFNAALATDYPACSSTFSAFSLTVLSGSVTYSSGNYTFNTNTGATETVAYTPSCVSALESTTLTASVCSSLEQNLNLEDGATASCVYATNCTCHSVVSNVDTTSGTYTVSGSTITDDTGSSYGFCVSGNTMTQREPIEGNAYGVIQLKKR